DEIVIREAKRLNADMIELHTGRYADCSHPVGAELDRILAASRLGASLGMQMNAGHGLTVLNVPPLAACQDLLEFSIGHSIICRSIFVGLGEAVREMKQ